MRALRLFPFLLASTVMQACVPKAVIWDEEMHRSPGALADSTRLAWPDTAELPTLVPAWTPATWPSEPGMCTASVRVARAPDGEAFASWFTVRADSSVLLRVARSADDGATWNPALTADSTDVGTAGCARPAPFIAADALNAYVHVVYHLVAREGAGLFFTHSMEHGAMFHEPVPIVYGDRPSAAAVTSRGDTVVVVYEDPNSRSSRLGLAISRTQGHIFERRVPASDDTGEAHTPRVALRDGRVALAWTVTQRGGGLQRTVVRLGTLVW